MDNVGVNDIHANASITLIDTLSALPTLYPDAFPEAVRRVAEEVSFDQDVKVQVRPPLPLPCDSAVSVCGG